MMTSESSSSQQLTPSSKVNFNCEDGIIAYNNDVALLEHPNNTLGNSSTRREVDDAKKTLTFSFSNFDKPLSFTHDDFIFVIGLNYSENYVLLPKKETVRVGLATLGLVDEDKPSLSSSTLGLEVDIGNIIFYDLVIELQDGKEGRELNKPLASEVALTSHMLKVPKISNEPKQSLILPSEEVNVDDTIDKSLSGTNVQPVTQPKAKTDTKLRKKKIPSSTKSKTLKIIRESSPPTQVADTQYAEEPVATANATQSLDASGSVEELRNQSKPVDAKEVQENIVEQTKNIVEEEHDEATDSRFKSLGNVIFEELNVNTKDNPFDTESKIKVVKRMQPQNFDDEDQIKFLRPVSYAMEDDSKVH
ncbi:hypothetical protein Tco_1018851 [Tanacetum coccineum]|uniref:Uncharacterized protein n=1 Tax=Tanacetum coccineum TaxID=301880 RepID=A0ABQ5FVG6_9ASTR